MAKLLEFVFCFFRNRILHTTAYYKSEVESLRTSSRTHFEVLGLEGQVLMALASRQARSQDLEKGGLFWKSEKSANDLDPNFHCSGISFTRFVRKLSRNFSESSEIQTFFPPKIRWSPKKKKKGLHRNWDWFFSLFRKFKRLRGGCFPLGEGYFQFFTKNRPQKHQKRAILHTSQVTGGARAPPAPTWLRYCLEASSPRKLTCSRLEDSTIFWIVKILWSAWKIFWKTFFRGDRLKNFCEDLFFFGEHLRLCPWFLTLASSIPVLGLESVCPRKGCPWP